MDRLSLALEAAPKALVYSAVLLAVGACGARWLLLRSAGPDRSSDAVIHVDRACSYLAMTAALVLVVAFPLRAWGHTAASFGITEAFEWTNLRLIAWESDWGSGWQRQMAGALAFGVLAWSTTQWGDAGWSLANLGVLALCYLLPLTGHAAGELGPVLLHGTHVLAAGLWVGTLTAAVVATRVATVADTPAGAATPLSLRAQMLGRFSSIALTGAGVAIGTGLTALWWYLGSVENLWSTTYGWAVLLKVIFVGDVATFGFLNWKTLHRPATAERLRLRPTVLVGEIVMAAAVVAVTAVLTELEHP